MATLNAVENRPDEPTREEVEQLADELQCSTDPIENQAARMLLELRRQRDDARRLWREELQERRADQARGVTGLPTLGDLEKAVHKLVRLTNAAAVAEGEREHFVGMDRDAAQDDLLATVRTLLSAAEQGARDREDAERFRGLEQFVVGITTRCSDGYEEDYERDDLPDEDGEEFREWIDFMLKNSRANEADAARQPRQEGGDPQPSRLAGDAQGVR